MKSIFIAIITAAGTVLFLVNVHLVLYDEGITIVRKEVMTLDDVWIDTRGIGPLDFAALPKPVRAFLVDKGWSDTKQSISDGVDKLKKSVTQGISDIKKSFSDNNVDKK